MSSLNDQLNELFEPKPLPDTEDIIFGDFDGTNAAVSLPELIVHDNNASYDNLYSKSENRQFLSEIYQDEDSDVCFDESDDDGSTGLKYDTSENTKQQFKESNRRTDPTINQLKRKCIEYQMETSDKLFNIHIRIQKLITLANSICENGLTVKEASSEVCKKLKQRIERLRDLRSSLFCDNNSGDDEQNKRNALSSKKTRKNVNKLLPGSTIEKCVIRDIDQYQEERNRVLQAWYDRTKAPSFAMLEQPILRNIEQALENLPNLIRRTQLKRFKTADIAVEQQIANEDGNNADDSKRDGDTCKQEQYNEEIFDDNDFFYALFERSVHKTGLGIMSSAYHKDKINKKKTKKRHHPSKGRMIRYNVHSKLANFYCPTLVTNDDKPINDGNLSFDRDALLEAIRNG